MNDKALAITTARFIATHGLFFALNLAQIIICLIAFDNFALKALFLSIFCYLFYLHVRLNFDFRILSDFANENLSPAEFDESLKELKIAKNLNLNRDMQSRCKGVMALYGKMALISFVTVLAGVLIWGF